MPTLTSKAKQHLSTTIRGLRERLLRDIYDEAERRYRLSLPAGQAGLDEASGKRRARLDDWLDARVRTRAVKGAEDQPGARQGHLLSAAKEAGATLLNRLVLLRQLEALGLSKPEVVTGGWRSRGYQELRDFAPGLVADETEGYARLLQMLFDELSLELPGLYGNVGLTELFPVPPATLRHVVTELDDPELESAWGDDTTLGWVYQYWNDPEREALDTELDSQDKLSPTDVSTKTQLFTERYMVEWLLQNSLGATWLSICKKNGWTPDAERVLPVLDARRAAWRAKRATGEVALDALMPIVSVDEDGGLEDRWKYYVPQPIPEEAVAEAPSSVRALKLLDPACGSGHFLVVAFDLLVAMYREEARHTGRSISDREIAETILESNLHGVDTDPRAVQLAAAGLFVKAKGLAREARPSAMNLVAPRIELGELATDDDALILLSHELNREVGLPAELTRKLVQALAGVAHLGTVVRVDAAVEESLVAAEFQVERRLPGQGDLFLGFPVHRVKLTRDEAKALVLERLERFLAKHSTSNELGIRLNGSQLAAGLRLMTINREHGYDVVVGNPPYFGTQALADSDYIDRCYPESKENLCTVLLERATELARPRGLVAFVTVRNWLYVSQLGAFRKRILREFPPLRAADLGLGGFESLPGVEGTLLVLGRAGTDACTVGAVHQSGVSAKAAALLCRAEDHTTAPSLLAELPGSPFVYRWSGAFIRDYLASALVGAVAPVRVGMKTSDNLRFIRRPWELPPNDTNRAISQPALADWAPYIKGAGGKAWIEPLSDLVNWRDSGLQIRVALAAAYRSAPQGEHYFFRRGVAFTTIGRSFLARAHRYASIFDVAGSSVVTDDVPAMVCLLNSRFAREVVEALNPTINFQVGDVARIPFKPDPEASTIFSVLDAAFAEHERVDELSPGFLEPGPSPWRSAQAWAQRAVDRPEGAQLPSHEPEYEPPAPESFVSFAVGVALGRFGANREGILDEAPASALPSGILFVSSEGRDSLEHPACNRLHAAWAQHGSVVGDGDKLRDYLRGAFFAYHRKLYQNRPIYFPLSSLKRSFVAFVSIHRWQDDTLSALLADHLVPEKRRLEGELDDIRKARAAGAKGKAERRFAEAQKLLDELRVFIDQVIQVAEAGPPSPDHKTTRREVDAQFAMDLGDGVMVNSAALWALLEPQWKDPRKWWTQVAQRSGPKGAHFDWSRTARRYFPRRVDDACRSDPVLASAHASLARYHPEVARIWERRLSEGSGATSTRRATRRNSEAGPV